MQIEVKADMANLSAPVRQSLENEGYSTVKVLNACKSHLGKLVGKQTGEDKRSDMRVSVKSDKAKFSIKPGTVSFTGTADIVNTFIAYNDGIQHVSNKIACMENAGPVPIVFKQWLDGFARPNDKDTANGAGIQQSAQPVKA